MKKLLVCVLVLVLLFGLVACVLGDTADLTNFEVDGFSLSIPSGWTEDEVEDNGITYHRFFKTGFANRWNGFLRIYTYGFGYTINVGLLGDSAYDGYFLALGGSDVRRESITICGELASLWSANIDYGASGSHRTYGIILYHGDLALSVLYVDDSSTSQDNLEYLRAFSMSIRIPGYEQSPVDVAPPVTFADAGDLSSMSFDELLVLRQQVDAALWASDGWQEVEVPQGDYLIGTDIPVGKWTVQLADDDPQAFAEIKIFPNQKAYADTPSYGFTRDDFLQHGQTINLQLDAGNYLVTTMCALKFTPYTGAALDFK